MDFFYPQELPISGYISDISHLLKKHQVIVVAGDTGSGKTTQLPKICLETFPALQGIIGCTQPRRVAATSVCDQVSRELLHHGTVVGSKIRFRDQTSKATRIKFMTDGILLAETRHDPLLRQYGVIIIDEAHERSLNIDFLIGYVRQLIEKRQDLKVVITSATIDTTLFSKHFDNAPVVQIEGRTYPVDTIYAPIENEEETGFLDHCIDVVDDICSNFPPGDILVFLPTEKDIKNCCEILQGRLKEHVILPMFGRLQSSDQQQIFRQFPKNKIVVATNVAETSVTVPGITYVVDSGLARISSYSPRSRTTSLPVTRVSQASCNQRKGRCGRVGPGTCFRLYSEDDYLDRPPYTVPEIRRSNLADVILQMVSLNLGSPVDFPFLEPPAATAIKEGYRILEELGAISPAQKLTKYGKIMAQLPIDPVVSRIIIEASARNCLDDIVIIASALAIQDPRTRPSDKEKEADNAHKSFSHPHSDFFALLNIWNTLHHDAPSFSWSRLKKFCKDYYLSFQRMREWLDLHEQLLRILGQKGDFSFNGTKSSYDDIHKSLLSGFFRQCARRKKGALYQTGGNREIMVFPGSHQFLKSGDWILAGFLMETNRLYAMTVATIEPEWVEKAAGRYCSYSWTDVRWQKKTGNAVADETVSLDGLPLITGRTVNYGRRDRKNRREARILFIQKGLVEGQISRGFGFLEKNQELIERWQQAEHRLRKKNVIIDDASLYDYYNRRLPPEIYDRFTLIKFLKKNGEEHLIMTRDDILLRMPDQNELADFPTTLSYFDHTLRMSYCFEPGSGKDGVTVHVPALMLGALKPDYFEWLVPGLLKEKTVFLLKGLPKRVRKHLIPINQTADAILDSLINYRGDFYRQLCATIFKMFKLSVHRNDWPSELPDHLTMRFSIEDADGREIASGRDLAELTNGAESVPHATTLTQVGHGNHEIVKALEDKVFFDCDFDAVPESLPLCTDDRKVVGYLFSAVKSVPERQGVEIVFVQSREEAAAINTQGIHYLLRIAFRDQFKLLKKQCKTSFSGPSAKFLIEHYKSSGPLVDSLIRAICRQIFIEHIPLIPTRDEFQTLINDARNNNVFSTSKRFADEVLAMLRLRKQVADSIIKYERLSNQSGCANPALFEQLRSKLDTTLPVTFLETFTEMDFNETPRYLKSLLLRTERAYSNPHKDEQKSTPLRKHERNIEMIRNKKAPLSDECRQLFRDYCFMVAELHVALFSPEIKTRVAVSEKKISRLWKQISSTC